MSCVHSKSFHRKFEGLDRDFLQFWNEYFQITDYRVHDLPIKHFMSAHELIILFELLMCTCNLDKKKRFGQPVKTLKCRICGKVFRSENALKCHVPKHSNKNFECFFCMKHLMQKNGLLLHLERHTREFECKICNTSLNHYAVKRHMESSKHKKNSACLQTRKLRSSNS